MAVKNTCLVYLVTTQNNVIVTVSDLLGNVLFSRSAGAVSSDDFSRKDRSSVEVWKLLGKVVEDFLQFKFSHIKNVGFYFKGVSSNRWDFLNGFLNKKKYNVLFISDLTKPPHNGCRSKRARRGKRRAKKNDFQL